MSGSRRKSIIPQIEGECFICGRPADHIHHCWHGTSNRKNADADGLTVQLCEECHRLLHDTGRYDVLLQQIAEAHWLIYYGASIEDFIKRYGKNRM